MWQTQTTRSSKAILAILPAVLVYLSKLYWYVILCGRIGEENQSTQFQRRPRSSQQRSSRPCTLTIFATVFLIHSMNSSTTPMACGPAIAQSRLMNNKACLLMKNGRYDDGVSILMRALRVAKNSAELHSALSMAQDDANASLSLTSPDDACTPEGEAVIIARSGGNATKQGQLQANRR